MAKFTTGEHFRQIKVDLEEWEMLGEKVGMQGRTAWIQNKIHEEVSLPDKKKELLWELEKHEKVGNALKNKLDVILKDEEETLKHYDEEKSAMENAIEEASNFIDEEIENDDYITVKKPGIYGHDKNREIADTFSVNPDDLLAELEAVKEFKTFKTAVLQINPTTKTATEYNK